MTTKFNPPSILRNRHLQTILNSYGPRYCRARTLRKQMNSNTLTLLSSDGTRLLAEYDRCRDGTRGLVILLHGWEGSSQSNYLIMSTWHLLQRGFDVLRINFRDHGASHHLNRDLFNSTRTPEVASAIDNFLRYNKFDQIFLAGYSLGGSFALRIAADDGSRLGIKAVAAICPPVNPANAMAALKSGWILYEKYFFRKWARSLHTKLLHFPELGYGDALASAKSVEDLNAFFVPNFTEFDDPTTYFAAYSLAGDRLAGLNVPGLLIASADDPIIPVSDIGDINPNPMLTISIQSHGGHCGFSESLNGENWIDRILGEIFVSHIDR